MVDLSIIGTFVRAVKGLIGDDDIVTDSLFVVVVIFKLYKNFNK